MDDAKTQEIRIELLVEHPENSNFMDAVAAQKLRRHIERTGRYEPLTVRPHPSEAGKFQMVNGHNRLRVLRNLNYRTVCCVVWDLDDRPTRLYLATLNRLSGKDVPERRAVLLDNLLSSFNIDELTGLLPDSRKQMDQLQQFSHLDNVGGRLRKTAVGEGLDVPVVLSFIVDEPEAKELNLALDLLLNSNRNLSRSQALVSLAHFYLEHRQILLGE